MDPDRKYTIPSYLSIYQEILEYRGQPTTSFQSLRACQIHKKQFPHQNSALIIIIIIIIQ